MSWTNTPWLQSRFHRIALVFAILNGVWEAVERINDAPWMDGKMALLVAFWSGVAAALGYGIVFVVWWIVRFVWTGKARAANT
jgi:Co/Zn/Cd efflux system component